MNKLFLRRDLISETSVQQAMLSYKSIAKISLTDDPYYFVLTFSNFTADTRRTMYEFENYATGLEVQKNAFH